MTYSHMTPGAIPESDLALKLPAGARIQKH
jgi:hypothetical protein